MERKQPSVSALHKYDWPELRGLVPNAASPPPRMVAPQVPAAAKQQQQQQQQPSSSQLNAASAAVLVQQPLTFVLPPSQTTVLSSTASATVGAPSVTAPRRPIQAWRNPSKATSTSLPPPTTYISLHGGPGSHPSAALVGNGLVGSNSAHASALQLPLALLPVTTHSNDVSPLDQPLELPSHGANLRSTSFRKAVEVPVAYASSQQPPAAVAAAAPSAAVGKQMEVDVASAQQHVPQLAGPILPKRIVKQPIPTLKRLPPDTQLVGGVPPAAAAATAAEVAAKGREGNVTTTAAITTTTGSNGNNNGEGGKQWLFQMPMHHAGGASGGGGGGGAASAAGAVATSVHAELHQGQGDDEGPSPKVEREGKALVGAQGLPPRVKVLVPVAASASTFTNLGPGQTSRKTAGGSAHYVFPKKVMRHSGSVFGGSLAGGAASSHGGTVVHATHTGWMRRPSHHAPPPNSLATGGGPDDETQLQVEGCGFSEVTLAAPANALSALESCVARERRAKEELQAAHEQVRRAFQQVVRAYFAAVESGETRDGRTERRGGAPTGLSIAKCSVVVHTLVTTIQSYLRAVGASYIVRVRRAGDGGGGASIAARRALAAVIGGDGAPAAVVPPLLSVDDLAVRRFYTPMDSSVGGDCDDEAPPSSSCMAAPESARTTTSSSSVHDMLLDQQTIARLKQLYFDYYDCETFVLDSRAASQQGAKVLPAASRTMSDIIEEHNVLEDGLESDHAQQPPSLDASCSGGVGGFGHGRRGEEEGETAEDVIEEDIVVTGDDYCDNDSFAIPVVPGAEVRHLAAHGYPKKRLGQDHGKTRLASDKVLESSDVVAHAGSTVATRSSSAASVMLNRSAAMRDIYGSPASASDLCSPFAPATDGGVYEPCEVEEL